ncbi:NTP-binding protein [Photorhabdus stackebrandtii]|uniref:NTP-binding protein n=1 Tax=Photorhabdus stackebrandtii TaxID=1123042 RepID=A0A7X5TM35_9GAMM|nr:NTP-binding protein [Photorhabdus stackebrandtii]
MVHRTADETCSEVGCTSGCQPCELVQSPSENDTGTLFYLLLNKRGI